MFKENLYGTAVEFVWKQKNWYVTAGLQLTFYTLNYFQVYVSHMRLLAW